MKINAIVFEKKISKEEKASLGTYSNEILRMEATLGENENHDLATLALMETVHVHLGVEFKSKVKDMVAKKMGDPQMELPLSDKVPSEPQLDRPEKIDEAAKELTNLKERDGKSGTKSDAKKEQGEPEQETAGNKKADTKASVSDSGKEEKVKEEKVTKPKGTVYDSTSTSHKTEVKRILEKTKPDWKTAEGFKVKLAGGTLSNAMEGEIIYTVSGKIAKKFHDKLVAVINGL